MNRDKIRALFKNSKVQNYTYNIFFFLVFSLFILFAIRPNLLTAFELQKEIQDLKLKDKQTEETILQIVKYQSIVEEYRDELSLLDEALPIKPEIAKVVRQISKSASDLGIEITTMAVEKIELQSSGSPVTSADSSSEESIPTKNKDMLSYTITLSSTSNIANLSLYINDILNHRRLLTYDSVTITSQTEGEGTVINLLIRAYYL